MSTMSYSASTYQNALPPSAVAGPSTVKIPPKQRQDPYCQNCPPAYRSILELTEDSLLACPVCGQVDETATRTYNSVSVSDNFGAQLDPDEHRRTFAGEWRHFDTRAEKSFQDEIDGLFDTYLVNPRTSLLGRPVPSLLQAAKWWFKEIRAVEKEARSADKAPAPLPPPNATTRRVNYQVLVAVKFAIQANGTEVVDKRFKRSDGPAKGFAKGDKSIPMLSVADIYDRANSLGPGHIGYIDSLRYFSKLFRRYSLRLNNGVSSLDICLVLLIQCVERLKYLVDLPHDQRILATLTKPKQSRNKREWTKNDWAWFQHINWDDVISVGHNLYQAQQCVGLWDSKCSPQVAVALTLSACQAVVGTPMLQMINITIELARFFRQAHWLAAERAVEMKNLLIAWSTSIPDAGLPMPLLPPPRVGGFGDGLKGYGGDSRRRIPEGDMAAAAGRTIADHWRTILRVRLKTRQAVLPIDEEHDMARRLFAAKANAAIEAEIAESSSANHSRATTPRPSTPARSVFIPARATPDPAIPLPKQDSAVQMQFWRMATPPAEKTIEQMLEMRDDSSDDGNGNDSDDEETSKTTGLGLVDVGARKAAFGFTIGPEGFNVDRIGPIDDSDPFHSSFGDRLTPDSSATPSIVSRHRSSSISRSDTGFTTISEAETVLPKTGAYKKPARRAIARQTDPASAISTFSASPLSRATTVPPSPTLSDDRPVLELSETADVERDHVGQLIREREQYKTYRQGNERTAGRLVSVEVEIAMKRWVEEERRKGSIPSIISPGYLATLGLHGDPRQIDLMPWVESMRRMMSPVEALLRIGIRPTEFPQHHIVHSLVHLNQQLRFYHASDIFAPIGQDIDEAQVDRELDILFKTGEEKVSDIILTEEQSAIRRQQIEDAGIWEEDEDKPKKKRKAPVKASTPMDDEQLLRIASLLEAGDDEGKIEEVMLSNLKATERARPGEDVSWTEGDEVGGKDGKKRAKGTKVVGEPKKGGTKRKKGDQDADADGAADVRPKKARKKAVSGSPAPTAASIASPILETGSMGSWEGTDG